MNMRSLGVFFVILFLFIILVFYLRQSNIQNQLSISRISPTVTAVPSPATEPAQNAASEPAVLGQQTKTTGCVAHDGLPDSACTPGAVFPNATVNEICTKGYTKTVRNVPLAVKDAVYAEYGIPAHKPGEYEVDHLISLELGGSNDISNLWPEAAEPRPGFHEKDAVENYLHAQVCKGTMTLQEAQGKIATDWLGVYNSVPDIMQFNYNAPSGGQ